MKFRVKTSQRPEGSEEAATALQVYPVSLFFLTFLAGCHIQLGVFGDVRPIHAAA